MAAEYEVNIKINSAEIERELGNIDKAVAKIGKPKGGGSRRKPGIAGLLPSSEELRAAEKGIVQLTAKTKNIQSIQDKFSERRTRALARSNALNEKDLRLNRQLTAEARTRLRLLSQAGAKGFDGTRPQGRQLANDINARAKAQEKRAKLANKINEMEAKGLNVAKLRKQLGKATTAQANSQFASAEKEFRLLRKTIELEESKLRILRAQTSERRFASSPIRGTPTMMGSPAQIAAAARAGGAVSPIGGRIDIPGSPAFLAGQQIPGLKAGQVFGPSFPTGGASSPVRGGLNFPGSPIALAGETVSRTPFGPSFPTGGAASPVRGGLNFPGSPIAVAEANRIARLDAGLTGQSSPIRGGIFQKGSPNQKRFEGVALGAGFPALFGGGAGSILGGGLGGLTGSFGAQIALSAIGQQIDTFVAGMVDAGKALTSVGSAADFMAEKSLFSSDAMQFRIDQLIEEGKVTEAAALLTQEMAKQVGGSGLKALKDLGTEASKMGKIFSTLLIRVQAFLAKALTPLLKLINSAVGGLTAQSQLDQMIAEAGSSERGAQILARSRELRGVKRSARTGKAKGLGQLTPEVIQKLQQEFPALIPEGAAIEPTELERLQAASTGNKDEERLQKRLGRLEAERKKVFEVSQFKDKIAAANAAEDQQLVIRLKGEQKIAEIEGKRLKDLAGVTDQREKEAINIGAATKKLAAHRDTERELAELQRKRQKKFETTIENLDHQLALARATTEEERERLRIEEALRKLRENDKLSQPQLDAIRTRMEALAEEKNLINTFLKETREQIEKLNDPMFQAISLATTLGNAFSESFRGIVDGSMSAQQALANLFQRTADHFLDMAAQMIAAQIKMQAVNLFMSFFSPNLGGGGSSTPASKSGTIPSLAPGLGGGTPSDPKGLFTPPTLIAQRALGGAVGAGRPYMVGERGPELFVPGAQGNIVPNNAMGSANVTVNVDASGSSVEGNSDQAAQLGKMLGAAVQAELVKQKRPGGLLAS